MSKDSTTTYQKGEALYEGKAKSIFAVEGQENLLWQDFKDSFTAFNGEKKATMAGKGALNCSFTTMIYKELEECGIPTHHVELMGPTSIVSQKLEMIPLEVVVRNVLAGSTAKKFAIADGTPLLKPLTEFFYKDDALGDPFISDEQALFLKAVHGDGDLVVLKTKALEINRVLLEIFQEAGIVLVDFKLEFGYGPDGEIILADEISPDSCRLWDKATGKKMDKDRFRKDLGDVLENYKEVLERVSKAIGGQK